MDYEKIYYRLVLKAKFDNTNNSKTYYEKHHIRPRSMGGDNLKSNMVNLTPRQHFVAHRLLEKITYGSIHHSKMITAVYLMTHKGSSSEYDGVDSRTYETLRKLYSVNSKVNAVLRNGAPDKYFPFQEYYKFSCKTMRFKSYVTNKGLLPDVDYSCSKVSIQKLLVVINLALYLGQKGICSFLDGNRGGSVDVLVRGGLLTLHKEGHKTFATFTDRLLNSPLVCHRWNLGLLYNYLSHVEGSQGIRGVSKVKRVVTDYNKTNPSALVKLLYVDKTFHLRKFNGWVGDLPKLALTL